MNRYKIEYECTVENDMEVDAENEDQAEDVAFGIFEKCGIEAPMITKVVELD
jgi:hypothetical protein